MSNFVLQVRDIDAQGKSVDFDLSQQWMESALQDQGIRPDPALGQGSLRLQVQRSGVEILVQGKLRTGLITECYRCLGEAKIPVEVEFTALLSECSDSFRPSADLEELTPEDLDRDYFQGEEIVLDERIREHLLLECPMQPLCSENCKGIAIPRHLQAPTNLASGEKGVDPRLAPLLNLATTPATTTKPGEKKSKNKPDN